MKIVSAAVSLLIALGIPLAGQGLGPERPPAVPLITHDPYFSVWSMSDKLTESVPSHWTGKPNSLSASVRVDGKLYRVMGREPRQLTPALDQTRLDVLPTRTIYEFSGAGVKVGLTFFTPALPDDLDVLSRPLTYLEWSIASVDGREHESAVYFDAGPDMVVNVSDQAVEAARYQVDGQTVLVMGSKEQAILGKRGDDLRIDWGYLYLAADKPEGLSTAIRSRQRVRGEFERTGAFPVSDDLPDGGPPRRGGASVLALSLNFGKVGAASISRYMMIAYDDLYSIELFNRKQRPWWRRNDADAAALLSAARHDHDSLLARSKAFDEELMADMTRVGGEKYARLAALAYRQTLAAHKLTADFDGSPMFFPKENFSNGCISTVDVIYPGSPFPLLFNPKLVRAELDPVMQYASTGRWKWPFAPHDLGTYPLANGQVYGGGETSEVNQMPVEESGNMLIMIAALAKEEGSAAYAEKYWPLLKRWADYLKEKGLDPENQLSTDDFAGHLAHNANLSIKAILALGSYSLLAEMTGRKQEAAEYRKTAEQFAAKWQTLAANGDHYRLAFDKEGTWSQKYNLVWDQILALHLFPAEIVQKEIAFYEKTQNQYGIPLDNRKDYTKLDWLVWSATLAPDKTDFEKLISPAYLWLNETPTRVPLTDWYDTKTGKQQGFQARSVVGGIFVKMLSDPAMWKKYSQRAITHTPAN
jgi:Domain of unknown function (DUF4965)/Domain of unknown function (DUF1793)/Domain of unknown function (DUF5127)/Domain of unknown function (DUF4964)